MHVLAVVLFFVLVDVCYSHTAQEWSNRTIYQLLTDRFAAPGSDEWTACSDLSNYCGGNYSGIKQKLDYIAGMGFDAVWISPFLENMGSDYHGYAFLDLFSLNPHFGSKQDLLEFVSAAHDRDIWVMLDVVANHVAPVDTSYELVNPFNQSVYYHEKCQIENWDNQSEVELCRLANLPDLDQNNKIVRATMLSWIQGLQKEYGFDGYRIDTVPEVHPDFWQEFSSLAGAYCVGEVLNGDVGYVAPYQQYMDGVLSYPLFFVMRDVFGSGSSGYPTSMLELQDLLGPDGSYSNSFLDVNLLGTFVDNHDNPRFLYTQSDWALYKNALTMTIFTTGIPIIYYGSEQGFNGGNDPMNRESLWPTYSTDTELYVFISTLITVRKTQRIYADEQIQRYATENIYVFSRGDTLVCLSNVGSSSTSVTATLSYLPYSNGDVICNAFDDTGSDCLTVENDELTIILSDGLPKIYVLSV